MRILFPIPVLLYHGLPNGGTRPNIGLDAFCEHLDWLRSNGWRSLTLGEFEAAVTDGLDIGKRRFLLTFDDNSTHLDRYAAEMKSRGFSGTAFIITGKFESVQNGWLTFDDAEALRRDGTLELQSHTHRHVIVGNLPEDLRELADDLQNSRAVLSERLGIPTASLSHLAWPWGKRTLALEAVARDAGFEWQYIVRRGAVTKHNKTLQLPRFCCDGSSTSQFGRTMNFYSSHVGASLVNMAMTQVCWLKKALLLRK